MGVVRSRYNLAFELDDALLFINTLSGAVDLADRKTFDFIRGKGKSEGTGPDVELLLKRGYLFPSYDDERRAFIDAYHRYIKLMQGRRVFLISPTYDCNLDCVYCFEKSPQDRGRS